MITQINKKVTFRGELASENFLITFFYEHEEGKMPEFIRAHATKHPAQNGDVSNFAIDLTFYPSTSNLQITCHNIDDSFNAELLNEVLEPTKELLTSL